MKYSKTDGSKTLLEYQSQILSEEENKLRNCDDEVFVATDAYSKKDGTLSASLFYVISGGTNRERDFFNELERKDTFKSLKVIFVSSKRGKGGLTPRMMNKYLQTIKEEGMIEYRGRNYEFRVIDGIYMITDVDHYENDLREILSSKAMSDAKWIISNPDIEVWIYYCFKNNPYEDLREVIDAPQNTRSGLMKRINGRFNHGGGLDPRKAFESIDSGIQNAKAWYEEDLAGFPSVLSTQMWQLAEDIIRVLSDEFCKWKEERAKKIQAYINETKE